MERTKLIELVTKFGIAVEDLRYDYDVFMTKETTTEECPMCGSESEIKSDGTSDCVHCDHKDMLPCSQCPLLDHSVCDWGSLSGCTPFPK